jgi:hypothetical protein
MNQVPPHLQVQVDALAQKIADGLKASLEARKDEWVNNLPIMIRWAANLLWPIEISETTVEAETSIDIIRKEFGNWTINDIMDLLGKSP